MIPDFQILLRTIDEALAELGTSEIVDAKKARNQLLDLRILCLAMETQKLEAEIFNVPIPSE